MDRLGRSARLTKLAAVPRWQFFLAVVGGSVAISEFIILVTNCFIEMDDTTWWMSVIMAALIPMIAASTCAYLWSEILRELNTAYRWAEMLANNDALTGLLNRRRFTEVARENLVCQVAAGQPTSLLLLDVDNFKQINDTHGHAVGDLVLQMLAATIKRCARAQDAAARWGGEEFVLLLNGTNHAQAVDAAEKVRKSIADQRIIANGLTLTITASVGLVTHLPEVKPDLDSLIHGADAAMYAAKTRGKNRVMVAPLAGLPA